MMVTKEENSEHMGKTLTLFYSERVALNQWFSTKGDFDPHRTFGNIEKFWLLQVGPGGGKGGNKCYRYTTGILWAENIG